MAGGVVRAVCVQPVARDPAAKRRGGSATELNAAINLDDWRSDPEIEFFRCCRIVPSKQAPNKGRLLPRLLAVTNGYILALDPTNPRLRWMGPRKVAETAAPAADGTPQKPAPHVELPSPGGDVHRPYTPARPPGAAELAEPSRGQVHEAVSGAAALKSKHQLGELEKITSKRSMPALLTFHWRAPGGGAPVVQLYLVERCRECIELVKRKFSALQRAGVDTTAPPLLAPPAASAGAPASVEVEAAEEAEDTQTASVARVLELGDDAADREAPAPEHAEDLLLLMQPSATARAARDATSTQQPAPADADAH